MGPNQLSIRHRLNGIVGLLLLPVGLLVFLFVQQSLKDIRFATKEANGVEYMRGVWPVLQDAVIGWPDQDEAGRRLAILGGRYDEAMDTGSARLRLQEALGPNAQRQGAREGGAELDFGVRSHAARALVTSIADGSNLILDPDLDSYYVMDVALLKLPEVVSRAGTLNSASRALRLKTITPTDLERAQVIAQLGVFDASAKGVENALLSAYRGNPDGELRRRIEQPAAAFAAAATTYGRMVEAFSLALSDDKARNGMDVIALSAQRDEVLGAADALWAVSAAELDRLIGHRIAGFEARLWTALLTAAAAVLLAVLLARSLARSVMGSIGALSARIRGLADGALDAEVSEAGGGTEIAQIAREVAYFRDRTVEKIEAGTRARQRELELLFEGNPMPMLLYDPHSLRFIAVNDAAVAHYGHPRERFLGLTLFDIRPKGEWEAAREVAGALRGEYRSVRPWRHLKADGGEIEVMTLARTLLFGDRQAVLTVVIDVTERRRAEAQVAHMAHHDALTGLANRVLFRDRLNEALAPLRRGGPEAGTGVAVLCLDLDQFKAVNDTLGHPVGDALLRAVCERAGAVLGAGDTIARLGGDEFAVLQVAAGPREAGDLARRLVAAVGEPFEVEGHQLNVGTSIGIALSPADGLDPDALLRNADLALYRAKADGRGTHRFFEAAMNERAQARRALELDLREALGRGRSSCTTSRRSTSRPAASPASRRWRAGAIPSAAW